MSAHPREHEEFLAELLSGALDPRAAGVARRLEACARCRELWIELAPAQGALERVGRERRELLAELERADPAPGEERLLATLEGLAAREPHARPRAGALWRWAAAAAMLAGAWLVWQRAREKGSPAAPLWLGPRLELVAPLGEVTSFGTFTWNFDGDAALFDLRLCAETEAGGADSRGDPLFETRCTERTWTPPPDLLAKLPARIVWEVEARDDFEGLQASASASAWLSGR